MQYKWKKAHISSILKTIPRHIAEDRTIIRLNLDPNVYVPTFDEYRSQMSKSCHHPPVRKLTLLPINREAARLQRLSSVTEMPVSSDSRSNRCPPPRKVNPPPVTTPLVKHSPSRRASISSSNESSIILTMQIDVPVKPTISAVTFTSPKSTTPPEPSTKSAGVPRPTSAAKSPVTIHHSPTNFECPSFPNTPTDTPVVCETVRETVLEWSARMKRYQQEEIQYLGLDIIKPHSPLHDAIIATAKGTPPSKFCRLPSKWMAGDRSLSKQRFEEWLDILHPKTNPTVPVSDPSTPADSSGNVHFWPPMDPNVCNSCGKSIWDDKQCRDWGVQTNLTGPFS